MNMVSSAASGDRPAWLRAGGVAMSLALLAGCGVIKDETASNLVVTPAKYRYHNCQLLTGILASTRNRLAELEALTARAAQSPGGQAIGYVAYRADYIQARGDEKEVLAAMADKNCSSESTRASDRKMY